MFHSTSRLHHFTNASSSIIDKFLSHHFKLAHQLYQQQLMLGTSASLSPSPGGPAFIPNATTTGDVPQAPSTSSGPFNPNMAQGPTPPGLSASPPNMTPLNSSSNAGSTGSMFTSLHLLTVPILTPGTDNALYFKGTCVEGFLDSLENHADNA
jgi:hypothetical protein